ncbi:hypothetical protein BH23BAC3_BH23BAC3_11100 [soil metagenome]
MSKKDTKSIKYVLNEMDPAEKIEFEREMEYDPDLLIEVESIKRMQKRLDQLPSFTPPKELSESVLSLAAEESSKDGSNNLRFFLTAAVLLLGLTTGSLFIDNPFESDGANYQASINLSSPTVGVESNNYSSNGNLSPWIDRNNILKLSGFDTGNYNTRLWELNDNHTKLRPSDNSLYRNTVTRSLHLTGQ